MANEGLRSYGDFVVDSGLNRKLSRNLPYRLNSGLSRILALIAVGAVRASIF